MKNAILRASCDHIETISLFHNTAVKEKGKKTADKIELKN